MKKDIKSVQTKKCKQNEVKVLPIRETLVLEGGDAISQNEALEHLRSIIPETYGEAIVKYKWLKCAPHEWDNRTYLENIEYVLIEAGGI